VIDSTRTLAIIGENIGGQVDFLLHGVVVTASIEGGKLTIVAQWSPHEFSEHYVELVNCSAEVPASTWNLSKILLNK